MANFLSISPNQTKFLPSVCLVPGLDFSAVPVLISALCSVFRKAINLYTFKILRVLNGQLPLRHILQILFEYCKYVYFNIHDSNSATAEFLMISADTACWEIERTFTYRSTFLYGEKPNHTTARKPGPP